MQGGRCGEEEGGGAMRPCFSGLYRPTAVNAQLQAVCDTVGQRTYNIFGSLDAIAGPAIASHCPLPARWPKVGHAESAAVSRSIFSSPPCVPRNASAAAELDSPVSEDMPHIDWNIDWSNKGSRPMFMGLLDIRSGLATNGSDLNISDISGRVSPSGAPRVLSRS